MNKNTPMVTRMNFEEHGGLADQTIYSADKAAKAKGEGYIPVKSSDNQVSDVTKYGGFTKCTGTYFFLVEHTYKGARIRSIEAMPLYLSKELDTIEKMEMYCKTKLGYGEPVIRLKKIKMSSLIKVDGYFMYLTGRTGNQLRVSNAVQLVLESKYIHYIKKITSAYDKKLNEEQLENDEYICRKSNNELYEELVKKHLNSIYSKRPNPVGEKLLQGKEKFESLSLSEQIYVLLQILQLSQLINQGADLELLGESKKTGVMLQNKKISDKSEFKVINQSPSGLYCNEVDLLTV